MSSQEKGGCLRLGCGFIFVLAVVVAVYAGMLYISALSVRADVADATTEAESFTNAVISLDVERASLASTRMRDYLQNASTRLNNWEWTVASFIPILNGDVCIIREEVSIALRTSDDALIPFVSSVKSVTTSDDILSALSEITANDGVVASAVQAHEVVEECVERADNVGTSHFPEVNSRVDEFNEALHNIDDALDILVGTPQDIVDSLASLGEQLTQPAE